MIQQYFNSTNFFFLFSCSCGETKPTSKRRTLRRGRSTGSRDRENRRSRDTSDERPPWGRHHSDRPYKKQSEKDPYSTRKLRKRPTRYDIT